VIAVEVSHREGVPVARVPLEVDAANAAQVREELAAAMRHEAFELVVDLSRTRFIDSAGLDMLFRLRDSLAHRRATLRVVIPPDSMLQRVAEIVGLPQAIPVYDSVSEAVAAAASASPSGPSPEPEG